ncbi:MAG: tripartite tricarboxylate transporter substrate binding protein, partial [Candidatus Marinimicrobia bacterium]|nr:tripartite tricarboxylate transporter substrate binding protein [Candidatus Neomarinimicrobiota bacterium]
MSLSFGFLRADFPSKPIKIVVYTGPGGLIDITARKFTAVANKYVDATFVVENKPGAGGIVALKKVLQSPEDGYSLYACT